MDSSAVLLVMANSPLGAFEPGRAALPGLLRTRYGTAVPDREAPDWRHLALYDIDPGPHGLDPASFQRHEIGRPGLDDQTFRMVAASAITPRLRAAGAFQNSGNPLLFVVLTNPVDGRETEYNDWYDRQHLPDVLAIPGFVAAQRFRIQEISRETGLPWHYLAIYEVAADAVAAAFAELDVRKNTPRMPISDALDNDRYRALYEIVPAASM
jgi:hypothetical protein